MSLYLSWRLAAWSQPVRRLNESRKLYWRAVEECIDGQTAVWPKKESRRVRTGTTCTYWQLIFCRRHTFWSTVRCRVYKWITVPLLDSARPLTFAFSCIATTRKGRPRHFRLSLFVTRADTGWGKIIRKREILALRKFNTECAVMQSAPKAVLGNSVGNNEYNNIYLRYYLKCMKLVN